MNDNPLEPNAEREARIRARARHLWESEGRPEGRDAEFRERARELEGIAESTGAGQLPNPLNAPPPRAEEADLQENLGEFPGLQTDQGDKAQTPSLAHRREIEEETR